MIVVDTSALMAVVLREPTAEACRKSLASSDELLISAGTLAETLIVAARRNQLREMAQLIEELALFVIDVTEDLATEVADAYRKWGKGFHRSSLNFGDCFAYALAARQQCPLLFIGDDFSFTDIVPALAKS